MQQIRHPGLPHKKCNLSAQRGRDSKVAPRGGMSHSGLAAGPPAVCQPRAKLCPDVTSAGNTQPHLTSQFPGRREGPGSVFAHPRGGPACQAED